MSSGGLSYKRWESRHFDEWIRHLISNATRIRPHWHAAHPPSLLCYGLGKINYMSDLILKFHISLCPLVYMWFMHIREMNTMLRKSIGPQSDLRISAPGSRGRPDTNCWLWWILRAFIKNSCRPLLDLKSLPSDGRKSANPKEKSCSFSRVERGKNSLHYSLHLLGIWCSLEPRVGCIGSDLV